MNVLRQLLVIGDALYKCQLVLRDCYQIKIDGRGPPGGYSRENPYHGDSKLTDDKERYLKMAIRIDPNDMMIVYREIE